MPPSEDITNRQQAQELIDFWFEDAGEAKWWRKDPEFDAEIARRYGDLRRHIIETKAAEWRKGPRRMLAAILMLDQFSRNLHRGSAEAFEQDPLARRLTRRAIELGYDQKLEERYRSFIYMPLMHSEDLDDQEEAVALYEKLDPEMAKFARLHRDQIEAFGRFPGRNEALGRESTPAEQCALDNGAAF